jgi:colicin import membrane protein
MQQSARSSSESYFWPAVWAVALHVLLFSFLFVSFHFAPELPPSKPIVQATLYQLKSQSQATTQTNQKIAGEAKKTAARQYEVEQMEAKKVEQQKQEAAEQKKAEAAQQAEIAKKADEQKQAEAKKAEEAKKVEEKKLADIAKKKAEDEKKKAAEDAKKKAEEEARKKAAENAKKKKEDDAKKKAAAEAARKKAQDAARKASEDKKAQALAELLSDTTERQQAVADTQGEQVAGDYDDLIRSLVSQAWSRPPSARNGMSVTVQINMLPDGTITNASVVRSSGDAAFDSSAVTAIRNVGRVNEMQGIGASDFAPYRSFKMTFTPEDLDL